MIEKIEEAVAYVETGEVAKGLRLLEEAERESDEQERFQIAQLYREWGHVEKAKGIVEQLLKQFPEETELTFTLAELLIDQGEQERAVAILSDLDGTEEDFLRASLLLADIYMSEGLDEVAERKLLEAKRKDPAQPVVTYALAQFYFSLGLYAKSVPHYEQLMRDGELPDEPIALRLADALSGSGNFEAALEMYEKADSRYIDDDGLFHYGFTAWQAGETQRAIELFERLRENDPDYGKLYLYLTKAYRAEGAPHKALETAERGMELEGIHDDLAYEAGLTASSLGESETAENYFHRALAINSQHHGALKALAGLYRKNDDNEAVIELLRGRPDMEEHDPLLVWYLASAEHAEENFTEAAKHYADVESDLDSNPEFLEEYGDFLLEEGRRRQAKEKYEKAVTLDPTLLHLLEKIEQIDDPFS
ncbi:MAG TPA: tetratricopeptide repeat protein [Bacillales bacterium]|nr:tetratricopeptide repeat protein [Bacillales bacterium]